MMLLVALVLGCGHPTRDGATCSVQASEGLIEGRVESWSEVEVWAEGGDDTFVTWTEADGSFSMEVDPGRYRVQVGTTTEPHTGCCGYEVCRLMRVSSCRADAVVFDATRCMHLD